MKQDSADPRAQYDQYIARKYAAVWGMALILAILVLAGVCMGSSGVSFGQLLELLTGRGSSQTEVVVLHVRLPRIASACAVGAALGVSGCVMQSVLHNPLASASTLGVSQGASFGAALAIVAFTSELQASAGGKIGFSSFGTVTCFAFVGGLVTTAAVLALSRVTSIAPSSMVLAGTALGAMFTGGTALLQYFADDVRSASVLYWTFGDLGRPGWPQICLLALVDIAALSFFLFFRWDYNALGSGVQTAKSLGVNVNALACASMAISALIVSLSVAMVGVISFVGLIAPHAVRRFVGGDYRFLIPCSAFGGSILMVLGELVTRNLFSPVVLPIGAVTSILGAPIFLFLILKGGGQR